jgi:hypothetical protein
MILNEEMLPVLRSHVEAVAAGQGLARVAEKLQAPMELVQQVAVPALAAN